MNRAKKVDVLIVEGFLSGFTEGIANKDDQTLSYYIEREIFKNLNIDKKKEIHSTRITTRKQIRDFVRTNASPDKSLFLAGKSMGVVKLYRELNDHPELFLKYNKIFFLSVDGHGKLIRELFKRPYGERRNFATLTDVNYANKLGVLNFYQRNDFPKGAFWDKKGHFRNIINIECPSYSHESIITNPEIIRASFQLIDRGWL